MAKDGPPSPPTSSDGESDPLFKLTADSDQSQLFADKSLLEVGTVPDSDRIVGRDDEIQAVAQHLQPLILGNQPSPVLVYGLTGTGKSLVVRHVSQRAKKEADRQGNTVATVYIDCSENTTETKVAGHIAHLLNEAVGTPENIPSAGVGSSRYYKEIWSLLNAHFDGTILILDEIDRLKPDEKGRRDNVLMQFSRAREAGKTDARIGIIGISNKVDWGEELSQRVKSSVGQDTLVFPPYDTSQIKGILRAREDAFEDGVLTDGVIPKAAAEAAREHGDARKAIRILLNAGEIAQVANDSQVREPHVSAAVKRAESDALRELLRTLPTHSKYILRALVSLTEGSRQDEFTTREILNRYQKVCHEELASDGLGYDRVLELLDQQAFLDIIASRQVNSGQGRGNPKKHRLRKDIEVVRECILPSE